MFNLTFEFSIEKLVHSIAYFSKSGIRDLTKLKSAKLLYFADKQHLLEYGKPILGDVYWCMDYGPVPSFALNEMSAAISGSEVSLEDTSDADLFSRVLSVKRLFVRYPRFEMKGDAFNPRVFSQTELEVLRNTAKVYGPKTAEELVGITHDEPTWTIANQGRPPGSRALISYELFFQGASEKSRRFLGKLVADQYGVAIPLAGDADYVTFANELAAHDFTPEEVCESDLNRSPRYNRV